MTQDGWTPQPDEQIEIEPVPPPGPARAHCRECFREMAGPPGATGTCRICLASMAHARELEPIPGTRRLRRLAAKEIRKARAKATRT